MFLAWFQSAPKFSPLTFTLTGDADANQWEVSQNAADDKSPLTCTPDCPQVVAKDMNYLSLQLF